jgi:hypothetical protein
VMARRKEEWFGYMEEKHALLGSGINRLEA